MAALRSPRRFVDYARPKLLCKLFETLQETPERSTPIPRRWIALHLGVIAFHERIGRKQVDHANLEGARTGGWLAFTLALALTAGMLWVANGGLLLPPPPPPPWW